MADYLEANGSSIRSIRRQIEGEIAWRRLQSAKIENGVSVGDDEVKAVIEKLEAAKGTEEYRIGEIFLSANPPIAPQVLANANKILAALQQGALLRRLCPPVFRSLDRRGRRRPRLGPARTIARADRQPRCAGCSRQMSRADRSSRRLFDRRGPGHAQGADRRSARCGAQPQAGFGQLPAGTSRRRPSRSSRASPRPRRTSAAAAAPRSIAADFKGEVVQSRRGQASRVSARVAGNDAADAGRPGDPPVRLDRGRRAGPGDVRPRRGRSQAPTSTRSMPS